MINVQAVPVGFDQLIKGLGKLPEQGRKAISIAINSSIRKGRTTAGREIRSHYVISQGRIYQEMRQIHSSPGTLYGALESQGPGIPIKDFKLSPKGPQPRRKPVITVEIIKGAPKPYPGGFVVGRFGMHVFSRKGRSRFPIEKQRSTSVPQMLLGERAGPAITTQINDTYTKEAARQIARIVGGRK
ncbi:MAG: hypothetical protein JO081_16370 [Alphaproteobacteria bacterium]|nr:hypothetical protein [Alphaproteobacteria bacterium]